MARQHQFMPVGHCRYQAECHQLDHVLSVMQLFFGLWRYCFQGQRPVVCLAQAGGLGVVRREER